MCVYARQGHRGGCRASRPRPPAADLHDSRGGRALRVLACGRPSLSACWYMHDVPKGQVPAHRGRLRVRVQVQAPRRRGKRQERGPGMPLVAGSPCGTSLGYWLLPPRPSLLGPACPRWLTLPEVVVLAGDGPDLGLVPPHDRILLLGAGRPHAAGGDQVGGRPADGACAHSLRSAGSGRPFRLAGQWPGKPHACAPAACIEPHAGIPTQHPSWDSHKTAPGSCTAPWELHSTPL